MLMTYYCRGTFALLHPCKSFFIVYQCAYSPLLIKITKIIANEENISSFLQCMFSYLIVQIIFPIFMKECLRCGQQDYTTIMSVFYFFVFLGFPVHNCLPRPTSQQGIVGTGSAPIRKRRNRFVVQFTQN